MSLRDKRYDGGEDYKYELVDQKLKLLNDIERKIQTLKALMDGNTI